MIKLIIPWLLFPYLIDWLDGNFVKAALAVAFLMFVLCFDRSMASPRVLSTLIMFKAFALGGERDILKSIPGRKIMQPEEVANMVFLLASRQFNTTGTVLKVGNGENIG